MFELSQGILLSAGSPSDIKSREPWLFAGGGRSLGDLTLDVGGDAQACWALLHVMREGEPRCIIHEIITTQSIVIRTDC